MVTMNIKRFPDLEYQGKEAFNTLCTNLFFTGGDIKKIMITSCSPQEGKSFIAMNMMRSLAELGMRVILVDADIRASSLQGTYNIRVSTDDETSYQGLTRYLAGKCDARSIIGTTNIKGANLILAGKTVNNSLPLLTSPRLQRLLDGLVMDYDVILVDAPPVGTIIDAAKIAPLCDGTVFVVQSGATSRQEYRESLYQLEKMGSQILGTVLNKHQEGRFGGKYYYHKAYYAAYGYGNSKRTHTQKRAVTKKKKRSV